MTTLLDRPAPAPTEEGHDLQPVRQFGWFSVIGVVMTLAYLVLFAWLRVPLGSQAANTVAWVVTAVGTPPPTGVSPSA